MKLRLVVAVVVGLAALACDSPLIPSPDRPTSNLPPIYTAGPLPAPPTAPAPENPSGPKEPDMMDGPKGVVIATLRDRMTDKPIGAARIYINHNNWAYETNDLGFVHIRVRSDLPVEYIIEAAGFYRLQVTLPAVGSGRPGLVGAWPGPTTDVTFYLSPMNSK